MLRDAVDRNSLHLYQLNLYSARIFARLGFGIVEAQITDTHLSPAPPI